MAFNLTMDNIDLILRSDAALEASTESKVSTSARVIVEILKDLDKKPIQTDRDECNPNEISSQMEDQEVFVNDAYFEERVPSEFELYNNNGVRILVVTSDKIYGGSGGSIEFEIPIVTEEDKLQFLHFCNTLQRSSLLRYPPKPNDG